MSYALLSCLKVLVMLHMEYFRITIRLTHRFDSNLKSKVLERDENKCERRDI